MKFGDIKIINEFLKSDFIVALKKMSIKGIFLKKHSFLWSSVQICKYKKETGTIYVITLKSKDLFWVNILDFSIFNGGYLISDVYSFEAIEIESVKCYKLSQNKDSIYSQIVNNYGQIK